MQVAEQVVPQALSMSKGTGKGDSANLNTPVATYCMHSLAQSAFEVGE